MPEAKVISCPECDRKLRVPDTMLGKKVKCPGCQNIFVANIDEDETPKPAAKAPSKPPPRKQEAIEETPRSRKPAPSRRDDDEDEDDRPSRRSVREEDDEDERPKRRSARDDDEDDDDDRPRRRSARDEEEEEEPDERHSRADAEAGWGKVRSGLTFIIISNFMIIGFAILQPLLKMMFVSSTVGAMGNAAALQLQQGPGPMRPGQVPPNFGPVFGGVTTGFMVLVILTKLMNYSSWGVNLTGHIFNMSAPERRGVNLKILTLITVSALSFAILCTFISDIYLAATIGWLGVGDMGAFISMLSGGFSLLLVLGVLSGLGWLTSMVTVPLTMRGICLAFGNQKLAKHVQVFLIVAVSAAALGILIAIVLGLMMGLSIAGMVGAGQGGGPPNAAASGVMASGMMMCASICLASLTSLGLLVWYIVLLFMVRGVVDRAIRSR